MHADNSLEAAINYRHTAETLRELAEKTRDAEHRGHLIGLAEQCEREATEIARGALE